MPVPVTPAIVEEIGGLTPQLFNLPDQPSLDALVQRAINRADAWLQAHAGPFYGITTPSWAPVLQEEGEAYLSLERLQSTLKSLKVVGQHYAYISEESPSYQTMMETNWGELAIAALDLWVTPEIAASRAFAMPQLLVSDGYGYVERLNDDTFPTISEQLSEELDWNRSISDTDIGTLKR